MRDLVQPDFLLHCGDVVEDARYGIQREKEMFADLKHYLTQAAYYRQWRQGIACVVHL